MDLMKMSGTEDRLAKMPQDIVDESLRIKRDYLWNDSVDAETANAAIRDFNSRWIAAGGSEADTIVLRKKAGSVMDRY